MGRLLDRCAQPEDSGLADGFDQVVVLGAGYDATGIRLTRGAHRAAVYEVDERETQARKRELLAEMEPGALERTVFVECDFARDSVAGRLTAAGHSRERRTLFSWLGVSWYLDAPEVEAFLTDLAAVAAPGSRIVFDDMHASALSGEARPLGARVGSSRRGVARRTVDLRASAGKGEGLAGSARLDAD